MEWRAIKCTKQRGFWCVQYRMRVGDSWYQWIRVKGKAAAMRIIRHKRACRADRDGK